MDGTASAVFLCYKFGVSFSFPRTRAPPPPPRAKRKTAIFTCPALSLSPEILSVSHLFPLLFLSLSNRHFSFSLSAIEEIDTQHTLCNKKEMEGSGKGGSSSSISSQLFGTNKGSSANANSSSSSSSSKVFDSVFSSSPTQQQPEKKTWYGKDPPRSQFGSWRSEPQVWSSKQGSSGNTNQSKEGGEGHTKDGSSIFHDKTVEQPCYLSSSLYYGGQDMYSNPSNDRTSGTPHIFKKDGGSGGEDDPNESNLNSASRGNWWQGSLYY